MLGIQLAEKGDISQETTILTEGETKIGEMAAENKVLKQFLHYSTGHVLSHTIGFITFPLLTRILIVKEYGELSLVTNTVSLALAIVGLGLQQSVVRYYEEFRAKKDGNSLSIYYSSFLLSSVFLGACGSLGLLVITITILRDLVGDQTVGLFCIASILVLLGCVSASLNTFLRVEQRTKLYNFVSVISRIGGYGFSFFFLFFVIKGLRGFLFGSILSSLCIIVLLLRNLLKNRTVGLKYFSFLFLKGAIAYGVPLSMLEISHGLLNYGDRYVIQYYLHGEALGLYTGAYTLCMHIVQAIDYPILSVVPIIYFELWEKKGAEAVQSFLRECLTYFSLIAFPMMFGIIGVGYELIVSLASHKFASSAGIIPYVVIGGLIFASSTFFSAGLYIYKKTIVPGIVMMISAVINLTLNFLLVPMYGITGAAVATLVGYASYVIIIVPISFKYLSYVPDLRSMGRYMLYSCVMLVIIRQISVGGELGTLGIRLGVGVGLYSLMVFGFESKIRKLFVKLVLGERTGYATLS